MRVRSWMRILLFALVVLTLDMTVCFAQGGVRLADASVAEAIRHLPTKEIVVSNDPIYGGSQRYEGYQLGPFLEWLSSRVSLPLAHAVVTFVSSDGYRSRQKVEELPRRIGILAYKQVGTDMKPFPDAKHGKTPFNPGPYALVWEGPYIESDHLPTPWSIIEVTLERDSLPQELVPKDRSADTLRGLDLWRAQCSRCHSINKVGGAVGPELNVPVNVTEYWSMSRLRQMIDKPTSLRWGSAMPSFSWLPERDREDILKYVSAMRDVKVCRSAEECDAH